MWLFCTSLHLPLILGGSQIPGVLYGISLAIIGDRFNPYASLFSSALKNTASALRKTKLCEMMCSKAMGPGHCVAKL